VEQPTAELREKVSRYRRSIEDAVVQLRGVVSTLRPIELEDGLGPAVRKLALLVMDQGGPQIDVADQLGASRFDDAAEATVYRIVQEAITNAFRHARATNVSIVLSLRDRALSAIVEDDGRGFDPDAVPAGHYGLLGMRERAALAGGVLTLDSSPGRGTTVRVEVPA
jgi:two-component system sensor histidine kinase DegS